MRFCVNQCFFSSLFPAQCRPQCRFIHSVSDTRQFGFFSFFLFRVRFFCCCHLPLLDSFRFAVVFIGPPLNTIRSISVFSVQFTSSSSCAAKCAIPSLSISISTLFASEVSSWVMWKCYDNLFYYVSVIWSTQKSQEQVSDSRFFFLLSILAGVVLSLTSYFRFRHVLLAASLPHHDDGRRESGVGCRRAHCQCNSNDIAPSSVKFDFSFTVYFYLACWWW